MAKRAFRLVQNPSRVWKILVHSASPNLKYPIPKSYGLETSKHDRLPRGSVAKPASAYQRHGPIFVDRYIPLSVCPGAHSIILTARKLQVKQCPVLMRRAPEDLPGRGSRLAFLRTEIS